MTVAQAAVNDYKSFVDEFVEEEKIDQNEASTGGTPIPPPAEGRAFARIVGYVELGAHLGMYQGKPKAKPDHLVRITLELSGKRYPPITLEDGTVLPQRLFLELNLSTNEKSRFYKLFRAINGMYGDKYKHFASMAADNCAFVVVISHRTPANADGTPKKDARTYANIWKDGAWQVQAPMKYDDDGEPLGFLDIAAAVSATQIFLFNRPRLVDWAKLFVDGQRDDGTSKNRVQELILSAVNFPGSPLEALLADLPVGDDMPEVAKEAKGKKPPKSDPLDDI